MVGLENTISLNLAGNDPFYGRIEIRFFVNKGFNIGNEVCEPIRTKEQSNCCTLAIAYNYLYWFSEELKSIFFVSLQANCMSRNVFIVLVVLH